MTTPSGRFIGKLNATWSPPTGRPKQTSRPSIAMRPLTATPSEPRSAGGGLIGTYAERRGGLEGICAERINWLNGGQGISVACTTLARRMGPRSTRRRAMWRSPVAGSDSCFVTGMGSERLIRMVIYFESPSLLPPSDYKNTDDCPTLLATCFGPNQVSRASNLISFYF